MIEAQEVAGHAAARHIRLRGIAAGAIVCACIVMTGQRASPAMPAAAMIAALTCASGNICASATARQAKAGVREDSLDARRVLIAILAELSTRAVAGSLRDIDLDLAHVTLISSDGETLRDVTLRLSEQGGELLAFSLAAALGGSRLEAGLRRDRADGRQTIYLETGDAGAFFRFTNVYHRMQSGRLRIAMQAPTVDHAQQRGIIDVRDFAVVAEPNLTPLVAPTGDAAAQRSVRFSQLRLSFQMLPGRIDINDGRIICSDFVAMAEGRLDLDNQQLALRGVLLPAFAVDRHWHPYRSPSEEDLVSLTYRIFGPLQAPVLQIDPMGPARPDQLRRLFATQPDDAELEP